jgi:aspartyl protease family protein
MPGLNDDQSVRLVYLGVLLVILVGSIGYGRSRPASKFRHLGVWLLIAVALVSLYAYRGPVLRFAEPVMREISPSRVAEVTTENGAHELVIARSDDGHFHVDAQANGASVRFLVDTGASNTVLTMADARRAGIDVDALAFNLPVQTANGTAFYASATLDKLTIGPQVLRDTQVGIMPEQAIDTSLLGMNSIDRFASWRVEGNRMVLVP